MRIVPIGMAAVLALGGCAAPRQQGGSPGLAEVIASSFRARGQAGLDRLQQTQPQRDCSAPDADRVPPGLQQRLQRDALATVRFPQDGRWLGDWRAGERIAQSGTGLQYTDAPDAPRGGGCYGCHRLSGEEIAYGTLGPSLYRYLERNGAGAESMRRTWTRIWNPHAYNACSVMPRFGDAGILTPEQIRDVMALLLDPQSPVNR